MEFVALALLTVFVFVLVSRFARRRKSGKPARVESSIEKWAKLEVTSLMATELELEQADVATTLGGSPDPDVVTRLEKAVRKIEIAYERAPGAPGSVDARVEIHLEGGAVRRSSKRFAWDALAADLTAEFEQSGAAHVYRSWSFPWHS